MREIYFVRHSTPTVQPTVPSRDWTLSTKGIDEARDLARRAHTWGIRAVYTSAEPKARATALLLGDELQTPVHVVDGLEELRFDQWVPNSDDFAQAIRNILEQPALSFQGAETADAAAARFDAAIELVAAGLLPCAVVTHGRVMSAWFARVLGPDAAFDVWRSMPMPGWARIDLDALSDDGAVAFQP